jgi:hypothetical protein
VCCKNVLHVVLEHLVIGVAVVVAAHYIGYLISMVFV